MCSTFDLVIPFLGNYPKDIMGTMETALCTKMFIRTLFLTAKVFRTIRMPNNTGLDYYMAMLPLRGLSATKKCD